MDATYCTFKLSRRVKLTRCLLLVVFLLFVSHIEVTESATTTSSASCGTWSSWGNGFWVCSSTNVKNTDYFEELHGTRLRNGSCTPLTETRAHDSRLALDNGVCNSGCGNWANISQLKYTPPVCVERRPGVCQELQEEIFDQGRNGTSPCYTTVRQVPTGKKVYGASCWSEWSTCSQRCGTGTQFRYFGTLGTQTTFQPCKIMNCSVTIPLGCDATVDVAFIVDSSGSIGASNFPLVKEFIQTTVEALRPGIDAGNARVSMIMYSGVSQLEQVFHYHDHSTATQINDAVSRATYIGGKTNTGLAMNYLLKHSMTVSNGQRPSVPDIVFVITDGVSLDAVDAPAKTCHDRNMPIYAIGVTSGINMAQLQTIATIPHSTHLFLAATFTELRNITLSVVTATCQQIPPPPPTTAAPYRAPYRTAQCSSSAVNIGGPTMVRDLAVLIGTAVMLWLDLPNSFMGFMRSI